MVANVMGMPFVIHVNFFYWYDPLTVPRYKVVILGLLRKTRTLERGMNRKSIFGYLLGCEVKKLVKWTHALYHKEDYIKGL